MISWERALYVDMLHQHVKSENDKVKDVQTMIQAKQRIKGANG